MVEFFLKIIKITGHALIQVLSYKNRLLSHVKH